MIEQPDTFDGIPVESVIREVKRAIRQFILESRPEDDIALKSVDLTLHVVTILTAQMKPKFTIPLINLEVGTQLTWVRENTQEIAISLRPEAAGEAPEADIVSQLLEGLRLIRNVARVAGPDEPQLTLDQGSIELKFAITKTGSIELLIFGGEGSKALTHTLKVVVGSPDDGAES
jgi:hypothetical protein